MAEEREQIMSEGCISVADAVRYAGISRTALYAAMGDGEIPYVKVGSRRLVPKQALEAFLMRRLVRDIGREVA